MDLIVSKVPVDILPQGNAVEEEIYDSALSRACLALSVRAFLQGCIQFIPHWSIGLTFVIKPLKFHSIQARFKAVGSALYIFQYGENI